MYSLYEKETMKFSFIGEKENGLLSEVNEILKFHKMENNPTENVIRIINSMESFLSKLEISPIDYYYFIMLLLDKEGLLDTIYACAKEQDVERLYEFFEEFKEGKIPEEGNIDWPTNPKDNKVNFQKVTKLSFEAFKLELEKEDFKKYMYQVYLDDI